MINTSVMMIIIEVAGSIANQLMGQRIKGKTRRQRTIPNLYYVHTFSFGLLVPSLINRMTAKDCHKASSQSVGDNDGTNNPCGYSKVSIWEYSEVQCEY